MEISANNENMIEINWQSEIKQSPIIFERHTSWSGIDVYHRKVMAGEYKEHFENFHEINVTLGGVAYTERQTSTGRQLRECTNDANICVMPANQPLSASWNDYYEGLTLKFNTDFMQQVALENNISPNFELKEARIDDLLIPEIGFALLNENDSESPVGKLYADSLSQTLAMHVLKNYSTANLFIKEVKGGLSGYKLRLVKEYVNDNLDQDLSMAELAKVAGLSRFHFSRAFRRSVGLTPQKYLMQQRIELAKVLLTNKNLAIVEISLQTGFKNQSHFTTLFRKFTNITPKLWRELKHA